MEIKFNIGRRFKGEYKIESILNRWLRQLQSLE